MTNNPKGTALISSGAIGEALAPFGVSLSAEQDVLVGRYVSTLLLWNHKLSLTSLDDPQEIVARHFGESIFAGRTIGMTVNNSRLADVGTGGGFPGLPLKIAFPALDVTLIEVNAKKCAFLREVILQLELKKVQVFRGSYADFPAGEAQFNYICSRALGDYHQLLNWAAGALAPDGRAVLWVGEEDSIRLGRVAGWAWDLPVPIPESQRRLILAGRPARNIKVQL